MIQNIKENNLLDFDDSVSDISDVTDILYGNERIKNKVINLNNNNFEYFKLNEKFNDLKKINFIRTKISLDDYIKYTSRNGEKLNKEEKKRYWLLLLSYCDKILQSNGNLEQVYVLNKCGRYYANKDSLQFTINEFRAFMLKDNATDIDIKNSQCTIIYWLCKKYDIECPYLEKYLQERNHILDKYNLEKMDFIKMINYKNKIKSNIDFVNLFDNEMKYIQSKFMKIEDFNDIIELAKESINQKIYLNSDNFIYKYEQEHVKKDNLEGLVMCYIYFKYEREIINYLKELITTKNINIFSNNYDGIIIEGNYYNDISLLEYININTIKKFNLPPYFEFTFKEFVNYIEYNDETSNDEIIILNDNEGANHFLKEYKNILKKCKGKYYIKNNNTWINSLSDVEDFIDKKFLENNYCMLKNNKIIQYSKNINCAINLRKAVLKKLEQDDTFENKFIDSTKYKLCFKNGVYDFRTKKFINWNKCDDVFTTIIIDYDFTENVEQKYIDEVNNRMLDPIFGYQKEKFLKYYARRFAGCVEDKQWLIFTGERNCGKSKIQNFLENTFQGYINTLNGGNFIYQKRIGIVDDEKCLSFFANCKYKRVSMVQEIESDKNIKISGTLIKKFNSGGDKINARTLFNDPVEFKIQSSLSMSFNDIPVFEPKDCTETLILFNGIHIFKDKEYIENRKKNGATQEELKNYLPADYSINDLIKTQDWINAFLHLIISNYNDNAIKIINDNEKEDMDDFNEGNNDNFEFVINSFSITADDKDIITNKELNTFIDKHNLSTTLLKLQRRLKNIGALNYRDGNVRGLKRIKINDTL
jgi:hypothetical protein